jgi:hypothetical protein
MDHSTKHIHFESDEDMAPAQDHHQDTHPNPSTQQPSLQLHCSATVKIDFDTSNPCYVLSLAYNPLHKLVAASLSNKTVKMYSQTPTNLTYMATFTGFGARITSVLFPSSLVQQQQQEPLLYTSCEDGILRTWDTRSNQLAEEFRAPPRSIIQCCDTNGTLIVAGAGDNLLFWDRKTRQSLTSFKDTHAQDITACIFAPLNPNVVISGSEDGLLAVFDLSAGLDEDEGFQAALNIDNAVSQIGFYGKAYEKLWCTSGTETLHLWEWAAACDEKMEGGVGALAHFHDARQQLKLTPTPPPPPTTTTAAAAAADDDDDFGAVNGCDYLIGCEYILEDDALLVAAGNNDGTAALFPVHHHHGGGGASLGGEAAEVRLIGRGGGHVDTVRSMILCGEGYGKRSVCVTGGEDARVCLWSTTSSSGGGGSGLKAEHHRHGYLKKASPY